MEKFFDIIPPIKKKTPTFGQMLKRAGLRFVCLLIIISLNWLGLSAVIETFAYMNDTETSINNIFQAGILDFSLSSVADFSPSPIDIGESATRTISIINYGNEHQYKITATNFSAEVCNYLQLEADLDGEVEYSEPLKDFVNFGPTVFQEPADWHFTLTLPADAPESVLGQVCEFDFVFFGSQTKNDLPFGTGFSDTEQIHNRIATAICRDVGIRSMGYWKTHPNVYEPYLPQFLGGYPTDEIIDTVEKAQTIFNTVPPSMKDMLKKQLLAMKFNIAHFGIGEYFVESEGKTLNEIVAYADELLRNPDAAPEELERVKNLLDDLNDLEKLRYCQSEPQKVTVLIPNGGESWWVGRTYTLEWTTLNLNCSGDSIIDIWYSKDSGETFANIVRGTENDGAFDWKIPLFINGYFVPSEHGRIKVVARCTDNLMVAGWDMSDADFCPPIDYSLLTPEEIKMLIDYNLLTPEGREILENLGLMPQESSPETPPAGEDFNNPPDESIPTEGTETTESIPAIETTTPEEDGVIFNETSENTTNAESPVDESIPEETQQEIVEGTTGDEQQPAIVEDENSIIEQIEESNANPNENPENPTPETSQTENNQTESGSPETIPAEENLSSPNG